MVFAWLCGGGLQPSFAHPSFALVLKESIIETGKFFNYAMTDLIKYFAVAVRLLRNC